MMQESGIDMDFDNILESCSIVDSLENYYELKSKPIILNT